MREQSVSTSAGLGSAITLGVQGVKILLQLAGVVLLSRLLTPEDLGAYALVASIFALGELLREFGVLNTALGQKSLSDKQYDAIFWFMTGLGVLAGLGCLVLGLTLFPTLSPYLSWVALVLALNGAQAVFQIFLARTGRFAALSFSDLLAQFMGLSSAIILASTGFGTLSLVVQVLVTSVTVLTLRVILCGWLPRLPHRDSGAGALLRSGVSVGFSQILSYSANHAIVFAIGATSPSSSLGQFNRTQQLVAVPSNQLVSPLNNVFITRLALRRNDPQAYLRFSLSAQGIVTFTAFSILSLMAFFPTEVIRVALGEQWLGASEMLRLLAVAGYFQVLSGVSFWMFISLGLSRDMLSYNLLAKPLTVILVIAGAIHHPLTAVLCFTVGTAISWLLGLGWIRRRSNIRVEYTLLNGLSMIAISSISFWAVTSAFSSTSLHWMTNLLLAGALGAALTLTLVLLVPWTSASLRPATSRFLMHFKSLLGHRLSSFGRKMNGNQ